MRLGSALRLLLAALLVPACAPFLGGGGRDDDDDDDDDGYPDDDDASPDDDDASPDDDDDSPPDDDDSSPDDDDDAILDDPELLVGRVFVVDLASATFVEPPGLGAILQSQIGDMPLLMAVMEGSDFSPAAQPGIHVEVAEGAGVGGDVLQELCSGTWIATAGEDGVLGTGDDAPGTWDNPSLTVGPTTATTTVQGSETTLYELLMGTTFDAAGESAAGGSLEALMDTRPLAAELDPEGGEDAICELVYETVGVSCEDCGPSNPGPFCLFVVAEDVSSAWDPSLEIVPRSAADIEDDPSCP